MGQVARRALFATLVLFAVSLLALPSTAVADNWIWKEGRQNIAQIARGKFDAALKRLKLLLEKQPKHGEIHFALAIAYAGLGNKTEAFAAIRRSLELGLPPERFMAGRRSWFQGLSGDAEWSELIVESEHGLVHGPLLGARTGTRASIWLRTSREMGVRLMIEGRGEFRTTRVVRSRRDLDFTATLSIDGLEPNTAYEYSLELDGRTLPKRYRLHTLPRAGKPARFTIAFGGGAAYTPDNERVFDTIHSFHPAAFLQLGDNVYIDQPELPRVQRYCYYRRQSSLPYRRLVAETPIAAIWDDHDFGDNDCRGGPEIETPVWKRPVWNVFRENWNNPSYGGGEQQPGCYFDLHIADVHFIFLDCRYYRTHHKAENASMLGPVQKEWFLELLRTSEATFRVIATSVPFAEGVKPGSPDPWDGFPAEREEVFTFIEEQRIQGVFFIAADRHRSDAWRIARPRSYDLYEFQSSRLTNIHTHKIMPQSLFGFNEDRSFGLLSFDTTIEDPRVTYSIVTIEGKSVYSLELRRSQLATSSQSDPQSDLQPEK